MTQAPPPPRLFLYAASDSDRAVILRQGPSKTFRMILWHRDTGRFEDGQWLKQKVYPDRCSLSPDGRHFLYFTMAGWITPEAGAIYTVLCQPPYFTALALFPMGDTWSGGGQFFGNRHYLADGGEDIKGRKLDLDRVILGEPDRDCPSGLRRADGRPAKIPKEALAPLTGPPRARDLKALYMRLPKRGPTGVPGVRAKDGALYREADGKLIRDFRDMQFEEIRAPYDDRPAT